MKQENNLSLANIWALDFIASRLLNFKRIQYEALEEYIEDKFHVQARPLLNALKRNSAISEKYGMLGVLNAEVLEQYVLTIPEKELTFHKQAA